MMKSLCCCCNRKDDVSTAENALAIEFKSMMKNPTRSLDLDLETAVSLWEGSINAYREREQIILENIEANPNCEVIVEYLPQLRDLPEQFVEHPTMELRELAKLRLELYKHQNYLGLRREMNKPSMVLNEDDDDSAEDEAATVNPVLELERSQGPAADQREQIQQRESQREIALRHSFRSSVHTANIEANEAPAKTKKKSRMLKKIENLKRDPLIHHSILTVKDVGAHPDYESSRKSSFVPPSPNSGISTEELRYEQEHKKAHPALKLAETSNITNQLSIAWAERMDKMDLTQGTLGKNEETSVHGPKDSVWSAAGSNLSLPGISNTLIKIKPKWPQFLIDIWFDVIKWNKYGRKQRRVLKLTEYHILNIKEGSTISKLYWYVDIARLWLENSTTLKIQLKGFETCICYISPMAPSIVQQITTRVQVRLALEKTILSANHSLDTVSGQAIYSRNAAAKVIEAIEQETSADTVMQDFARGLVDKVKKNNENDPEDAHAMNKSSSVNLFTFTEGSIEQMIIKEVQNIVFDDSTDEGNSRKAFIKSFNGTQKPAKQNRSLRRKASIDENVPEKTLLDIRHFVDGLHEYFLSARGMEMAILMLAFMKKKGLEKEDDKDDRSSLENRNRRHDKARNSSASDQPTRKSRAISKRTSAVPRASIRGIRDVQDLSSLTDEELATLSFLAFTVIEEAVYLPLKGSIKRLLPSSSTDRDPLVRKKMKQFKSRTQIQWGIGETFVSQLGWETAIFELSGLERAQTPSMQLNALVRCCKAIFAEFKNCVLPSMKSKEVKNTFLGADNLVPIFVYVLCQSSLETPNEMKEIMWTLCHPDQLHGESGYYLTVFESCIEFIEVEPMDDIPDTSHPKNTVGAESGGSAAHSQIPAESSSGRFGGVVNPLQSAEDTLAAMEGSEKLN